MPSNHANHGRCPRWCVRDHHTTDHIEDQDHHTESIWLPALLAHQQFAAAGRRLLIEPDHLVVATFQSQDQTEAWLSVTAAEDSRQALTLDVGSASRLVGGLQHQLGQLHR